MMSEITNEERREVAEIMRDEAQLWNKSFPGTCINLGETSALLQDIMHFVGIRGKTEPETIYNRLADLIDRPTCHLEWNVYLECWECSNCGETWGDEYDEDDNKPYFKYCSMCSEEMQE